MTMRAIAAELGVSMPTLYRRIKAEGIDLASLRDDSGGITAAGAAVIASLFDAASSDTEVIAALHERVNAANQHESPDTSRGDTALQVEAEVLRVKLEASETERQRLEDELIRLRDERDRLLSLLEAEQRQRQLLLTDGGRQRRQRRGLFGLFHREADGGD